MHQPLSIVSYGVTHLLATRYLRLILTQPSRIRAMKTMSIPSQIKLLVIVVIGVSPFK